MPRRTPKKDTSRSGSRARYSDDESVGSSAIHETDLDDDDNDPVQAQVKYQVQSNRSKVLIQLCNFLKKPELIVKSGDKKTNIVNRRIFKNYHIPEPRIGKFFRLYEQCRRDKEPLMLNELQQEYSGVVLDFDIYQDEEEDQLTKELFTLLAQKVCELFNSVLDLGDDKTEIYSIVTRRPKITWDKTKNCYKDGFHMLFPGVQVTRSVKIFLIDRLINNDYLDQIFKEVEPADMKEQGKVYSRDMFLDKCSAYFPVFFVGSASKPHNKPYKMSHVIKTSLTPNASGTPMVYSTDDEKFFKSKRINVAHECSINYEAPKCVIKKIHYEPREQYATVIGNLKKKAADLDQEIVRNYGRLSTMSIHDSQVSEIKQLLDALSLYRAENYTEWRKVLCVLANTSTSYKDLAEYFSRKSKKFSYTDFEKMWNSCVLGVSTGKSPLSLGSLHYWARLDNPDRYNEIRKGSVYQVLCNMVYTYRDGSLSHADVAELLGILLKYKFVTDKPDGSKKRVWYEFVMEGDPHLDGQLYKWRSWDKEQPITLVNYISRTLPLLFEQVLGNIRRNADDADVNMAKYYNSILKNFKTSMKKLGDKNFINNVISLAEAHFYQCGFSDKLDKDPLIRGVLNGVLKLSCAPGGKPQLIKGYHSHLVSKYTESPYYPFNPYDPKTEHLLRVLRNLFPDKEPDSHNFTMKYLASTIDGKTKESMIMLIPGGGENGKSFLVEIHKGAIGKIYGVKLPISYLTGVSKNSDNATPAQMMLKDATLATYSESNKHDKLNTARVKEVTGQEYIAGRKLHQDMINFKPRCHHLVTTNHDFDINCNDHGTWRRIKRNPFKIRFVDPYDKSQPYDPDDPYQRVADPTVSDKWTEDPEICGRYLGYMVWEHWWLYRKYHGKVAAVPHPHIQAETMRYRKQQNLVEQFITQRLVKCSDGDIEHSMESELQKYITWYGKASGGEKLPSKGLINMFKNSSMGKLIHRRARGMYLKGHRFLGYDDELGDDEKFAQTEVFDFEESKDNLGVKPETTDEYIARVKREYDLVKHIFDTEAEYDINPDAIIDYNAIGHPGSTYAVEYKAGTLKNDIAPVARPRHNNLEDIPADAILPNGIVLGMRKLQEPNTNMLTGKLMVPKGWLTTEAGDIEIDSDDESNDKAAPDDVNIELSDTQDPEKEFVLVDDTNEYDSDSDQEPDNRI